jgi:hypothetical protein
MLARLNTWPGRAVILLIALALAYVIFKPTPGHTADLGANAVGDLEERIAELEATVARKGNRKVSLTISGWVAEQVTWWDDGAEQNVYVGGLGRTLASHLKLSGEARITPVVSAGYVVHVELLSNDALDWDQTSAGGDSAINLHSSYWFLKSQNLGKLSVGKQSMAADNAAILVDGSGSLVPANWVLFDGNSFFLRGQSSLNGARWSDVTACRHGGAAGDCAGGPIDGVRYDTPVLGGFSASAGWGEDDYWDAALRYSGEFQQIKIAATIAYNDATDATLGDVNGGVKYLQAAAYLEHVPSGVFVYGAYGRLQTDGMSAAIFGSAIPDGQTLYGKAGIRASLNSLGKTVFYGEYMQVKDQMSDAFINGGLGWDRTGSDVRMFGAGIVQEVNSAAMSVWLKYRHIDGDYDRVGSGAGSYDLEAIQFVGAGALVNF